MVHYPKLMPRQTRPRGPGWPVDDAWKRGVQEDMKKAGISPAEMARRIPCTPGALSKLWLPQTRVSRLVPMIHRELGRPAPAMAVTADEILRRINARWPSLSKENRILVDQLVDQLLAGRRE